MKLSFSIFLVAAIAAIAADSVSIYEQTEFRTATLYAHNSNRRVVLYKLTRTIKRNGNHVDIVRDFTTPQGKVDVRETVGYDGNQLVSCGLVDFQTGSKGFAKAVRDGSETKMVFEYTKDGKEKTGSETLGADTVNNDMINVFLVAHWNELMSGKTVKSRYIVMSRCETVGFDFTKTGESTARGMPVVIVKMAPSSMLVAAVVDPLIFNIEKNGRHRVLDYDGRTTPKIKVGDKLKDLDALTVFDW